MNQGGILSGLEIKKSVESGDIIIDPWEPTHVNPEDRLNPASYDLTLGDQVAVYSDVVFGNFEPGSEPYVRTCIGVEGENLHNGYDDKRSFGTQSPYGGNERHLDAAKPNQVKKHQMDPKGFLLKPGIGYLMHTAERVKTDKFVPIVDGKSSMGRLFLFIHVTAGYGDPGFDGQYTLEMVVIHPLVIYPGMRICQIRFHTLVGDAVTYQNKGNYRGTQVGPVESMSWKMFKRKSR